MRRMYVIRVRDYGNFTSSAGSVAGTVYWTNSGTGSVYLSSVGSFSRLSNFFDISNMAAG